MGFKIAIDGPAGAGKSTIAKRVAKELGFTYMDTGAMYRAIGLLFDAQEEYPKDSAGTEALCDQADIMLRYEDGVQHVYLNGEDVSGKIRTEKAGNTASYVSTFPEVRAQRRFDELKEKGQDPDYDQILADLLARDHQDRNRKVSPLKQADDAVLIDTSDMNIEEVTAAILDLYEKEKNRD